MRRQQFRTSQTALRGGSTTTNNNNNNQDPVQLVHSFDYGINPSKPVKSSPLGSSTIAGLPLELLGRLKAFPLFKSAPEAFLLSIGRSLRPNIFQASQEIIREGEDARAMYWLVRGGVKVTSRDGESTYAELRPGSFFGEIGILMDMPRTASIVATVRSLVVRLNKEDLQKELPRYPAVERSIREEALERLAILQKAKKEHNVSLKAVNDSGIVAPMAAPRKRSRDWIAGDVEMGDAGVIADGAVQSNKRRKSPSPSIADIAATTAIGTDPPLTVRRLLKELPLFASLPNDVLHFLGVNAQQVTFAPFTDIIRQGSHGRDVFFMIKGEVEVLSRETIVVDSPLPNMQSYERVRLRVKARLKAGQFFGEVTNLSLSPQRTATVRSINTVECLVITGGVLDELWQRCSPALKQQVEVEAKRRLAAVKNDKNDLSLRDEDVDMSEGRGDASPDKGDSDRIPWRDALPTVTFDDELADSLSQPPKLEPLDPDPFFNQDLDNMRAKSRRASLAPSIPGSEGQKSPPHDISRAPSPPNSHLQAPSPLRPRSRGTSTAASNPPIKTFLTSPSVTRRASLARIPANTSKGRLPDSFLVLIFQHLHLLDLMRLRLVSMHWHNLISTSPDILAHLDLSLYNRHVTDSALSDYIIPFIGKRPKQIDLSNCFHITDEGFKALAEACGSSITTWKMKSVWDVSGPAVLSMVEKAKGLEEIDLSNCRKVGDNLLARVVGWIVPEHRSPPQLSQVAPSRRPGMKRHVSAVKSPAQPPPPPGTVIGAAQLKRLTLSYCKHIQDRSMAHIAMHASDRLESLDLTRCTSISDAGFNSWGVYSFRNMRRLVLADCTYLSDQAIVGVVGGCRGLLELDLSFCCALSDTATEVLALGLPALQRLNMAFCGSAISDNSLRCIGLHLLELRYLSVRGCVRVTGQGVEGVVEGCTALEEFDVSQCKNLRPWLDRGGVTMVNAPMPRGFGRSIVFDIVADGTWRR